MQQAGFSGGTASHPWSEVELTLSCRNLRNMDLLSKSDPMIVVSCKNSATGVWNVVARTEVIKNNLNPNFATKVVVDYHFEEYQLLKFDVYDIDTPNILQLEEHDYLGSCTTSLGQIVSSSVLTLDIDVPSGPRHQQKLIIVAEKLVPNKDEITIQFSISDVRRKWWKSTMDDGMYLELHKVDESGTYSLAFRSETKPCHSITTWKPITLLLRSLCGGDYDRSIKIQCLCHRLFGDARPIGETCVTVRQLLETSTAKIPMFSLKRPNEAVCALGVRSCFIEKVYSFLEFVMGGMQIHCTVAIDFTSSNGQPSCTSSLHHISATTPNQYEQALRAVVEILQDYDSDKMFPVLGFGANIPPNGILSHCFYVNLHPSDPHCNGVEGVLEAYSQCIRKVQLSGPTNFSPIIKHVVQYAKAYEDGQHYFILLIVTDGIITDMLQTKQVLVESSHLPFSVIIVGVGHADFSAMSELDGDDCRLSFNGQEAVRDIVQFVPYREFQGIVPHIARQALAKEVLAEIPDQVVGYMRSKRFKPLSAKREGIPSDAPPPYSEVC